MARQQRRPAAPLALLLLAAAASRAAAFYLPGVAPQDFKKDDGIFLKVNKLSSTKTQLPYDYYSLPYCRPEKIVPFAENLGEVLRGDRIENSLYEIKMRADEQCKVLCRIEKLTAKQARAFRNKIDDDYKVNMILDNLPVAMVRIRQDEHGQQMKAYERGFPVGFKATLEGQKEVLFFLHNHLRFNILYNRDAATDLSRIVGFEVEAFSVKHAADGKWGGAGEAPPALSTCNPGRMIAVSHSQPPQQVGEGEEVVFTYDVKFTQSTIRWASRWDTYLKMTDDQIHWFSIVNSVMIVLFLSGMVAMIMVRTLWRDIAKYNALDAQEEAAEESGWKLVHGDVLRPPANGSLLATYVGVGVQILGMLLITTLFALLGFLSPSNRGGLMTAMVLMFVFMGAAAGYAAARLYKSFRGEQWKAMTARTALLFPGVVFGVFFVLDLLIWGQKSSGAVPFGTLLALTFLWFGVSVPLVFVGSYYGFKAPAPEDPVRTNKIPRQVPEQPWWMHPAVTAAVGGVLPFGAVFIELFFILTSVWLHQFYYLFGFLALVFVILALTCAEIAIVLTYFQLCAEDYNWWWRSYFTSGASALYLFAYSAFYFFTKLDITKVVPMLLYFVYMAVVSYGFFCLTGTIGFYACLWFVRAIYGAIKLAPHKATAYGGVGQKMLEAMGWSKGQGLGKEKRGMTEALEVKKKEDTLGVGAAAGGGWKWDWRYWEDAYTTGLQSLGKRGSSKKRRRGGSGGSESSARTSAGASSGSSSESGSGSGGSDNSDSDSSSSSSGSDSSDSDSSESDAEHKARLAAAVGPALNRDGTTANASAAELKLAAALAKGSRGPAGRFGGREGKMARIRAQEAAQAAAVAQRLGGTPAASKGPGERGAAARPAAPAAPAGGDAARRARRAKRAPARRAGSSSSEDTAAAPGGAGSSRAKRKQQGDDDAGGGKRAKCQAGAQQQQEQAQAPAAQQAAAAKPRVVVVLDVQGASTAASFKAFKPTPPTGWWGAKMFASAGLLEGLEEEGERQRTTFDEDKQTAVYMAAHATQRQGKRGLGKRGLKIAGGNWEGSKVTFDDPPGDGQDHGQGQGGAAAAPAGAGGDAGDGADGADGEGRAGGKRRRREHAAAGASEDAPGGAGRVKWAKLAVAQLRGAPGGALKWKRLWPALLAAAGGGGGDDGARAGAKDEAWARLQASSRLSEQRAPAPARRQQQRQRRLRLDRPAPGAGAAAAAAATGPWACPRRAAGMLQHASKRCASAVLLRSARCGGRARAWWSHPRANKVGPPRACATAAAAAATGEGGAEPAPAKKLVKRNVALHVGYVGSAYTGLQANRELPHLATIEGVLERALLAAGLISEANFGDFRKTKWSRSSRTDKGVHSLATVIGLRVMVDEASYIGDPEGICYARAINAHLPRDVRVLCVQRTNKSFNARRWCGSRTYEYYLPAAALGLSGDARDADAARLAALREVLSAFVGYLPFHNYAGNRRQYVGQRAKGARAARGRRRGLAPTVTLTPAPAHAPAAAARKARRAARLAAEADGAVPAAPADAGGAAAGGAAAPSASATATASSTGADEASEEEGPRGSWTPRRSRSTLPPPPSTQASGAPQAARAGAPLPARPAPRPAPRRRAAPAPAAGDGPVPLSLQWRQTALFLTAPDPNDPVVKSHYRLIRSFTADDPRPLVPGGVSCVRLEVWGDSFMLHQIRHMVAVAAAVVRGIMPRELLEVSLSAPGRVSLPRAPPHTLLLSGSVFSPFPTGWGNDTPLVAQWTGDRLRVREAAQQELADFRREVFDVALNELLHHPDWDTWGRKVLPRYTYAPADVAVAVSEHAAWLAELKERRAAEAAAKAAAAAAAAEEEAKAAAAAELLEAAEAAAAAAAPAAQRQRCAIIFDKDGSGTIDTRELRSALAAMGQTPSDEELAVMIHAVDIDGSGEVSFDEFLAVVVKHKAAAPAGCETDTLDAFVALGGGADRSGRIRLEKLRATIKAFELTLDIDRFVREADLDLNGTIDFAEFKAILS
ncbi:TMN7 [Scenedesmus sp. PABB004]|nr:TMN7 [Scenedesmus sp. PABB004]